MDGAQRDLAREAYVLVARGWKPERYRAVVATIDDLAAWQTTLRAMANQLSKT